MIDLRDFHNELLDILIEFDRICRENNIKYSLAFGTLLGAVRHKGFIPWDDDVDVMMERNDYDYFCKICPEKIGNNYFFQSRKTEKKYPYNICRIRKNNTAMIYNTWKDAGIHLGIYIDIYPIDKIPNNKIKRIIQKFFIILNTPVRISRNPVIFFNGGQKFNAIIKKILYYVSRMIPIGLSTRIENYYLTKYNKLDCNLSGIICEGGTLIKTPQDMKPFKSSFLSSYKEVSFEGHSFLAVSECDGVLSHWYGDYMKLPPENERVMYHQPDVFDTKHSYELYI